LPIAIASADSCYLSGGDAVTCQSVLDISILSSVVEGHCIIRCISFFFSLAVDCRSMLVSSKGTVFDADNYFLLADTLHSTPALPFLTAAVATLIIIISGGIIELVPSLIASRNTMVPSAVSTFTSTNPSSSLVEMTTKLR